MTSQYNATIIETWENGIQGTFVAHVEMINGRYQMTRSNSITCTGYEDKIGDLNDNATDWIEKYGKTVALYDVYLRERNPKSKFEIILDNCDGYKNKLKGII